MNKRSENAAVQRMTIKYGANRPILARFILIEGFVMPAIASPGKTRGFIIPIGGAEDRTGSREILKRFVGLCGPKPSIAIIPTASRLEDTGRNYQDLFRDLDRKSVV